MNWKLIDEFYDSASRNEVRYGKIVFTKENWTQEYSEEERTYIFNNQDKYFDGEMLGSSWWGYCLGSKDTIRLDWYIPDWKVESIEEISESDYQAKMFIHKIYCYEKEMS